MLFQKFLTKSKFYQLLNWALCLYVITLPFVKVIYNLIALGIIVAISLMNKDFLRNVQRNWKDVLITSSYFILIVLSSLYSDNVNHGLVYINRSVGVLLLSISIFSLKKISKLTFFQVLLNFIIALTIFSGLGILFAFIIYFLGYGSFFQYYAFSDILNIHSSYFGMFVSFSLSILVYYFLFGGKKKNTHFYGALFSFLVLIVTLYMLTARSATLIFLVISLVLIAIKLKKRIPSLVGYSLVLTLIITISTFTIVRLPNFQARYKNLLETKMQWKGYQTENELLNRKVHYQSVVEAWLENPLIGNGIGDSRDVVLEKYLNNSFIGYKKGYNAHNQYLEILSESGIIGLLVLLMILSYSAYIGFKYKNCIIIIFIVTVGFAFLTETMLHRIHGISFFAFFIPLMIHFSKTSKAKVWV